MVEIIDDSPVMMMSFLIGVIDWCNLKHKSVQMSRRLDNGPSQDSNNCFNRLLAVPVATLLLGVDKIRFPVIVNLLSQGNCSKRLIKLCSRNEYNIVGGIIAGSDSDNRK